MARGESGSGKCVGRAERGIYRGDNRTTQVDSTTQSAGVTSAPGPNKDKQYESSHCGVVPTHLITTLASSRLISTSQPPSDKLGELPPPPSPPPSLRRQSWPLGCGGIMTYILAGLPVRGNTALTSVCSIFANVECGKSVMSLLIRACNAVLPSVLNQPPNCVWQAAIIVYTPTPTIP